MYRSWQKSNSGFTLLEVMTVIGIMAVVSGIAGYSFLRGISERKVSSAAYDLYAAFREASSLAVNRGEQIAITFDIANDSYRITDSSNNEIVTYVFPEGIDLCEITGAASQGGNENKKVFTYNPRGMMGCSGKVKLRYKNGTKFLQRGVRVTSAGGICLIDVTDDNWKSS